MLQWMLFLSEDAQTAFFWSLVYHGNRESQTEKRHNTINTHRKEKKYV